MYYRHNNLIADKGLNLFYDCAAICVHFTVPSERFEFKVQE